jgi:hypothetical protein
MVHYHNDYIWGKEQEDYTYPILKAYFKTDLKQYTSQYDDFDFYDEESDYEQKSRKNTYSAFDETMITLNKTQKATKKKILKARKVIIVYCLSKDLSQWLEL